MSLPFEIEKNLDAIRAQIASVGAELVEITFRRFGGRPVLTVTADKEGGITLDECARINERLGLFFDEKAQEGDAFLSGPYNLEVVSPGLDRPLKTEKDFHRAIGDHVLMTFKKEDGSIATWKGRVEGADASGVRLALKDGAVKNVALDRILHAHREINVNGKKR